MFIKIITVIIFFLAMPFWAEAAEFRLESDNTTFGVGDEFLVQVTVDTEVDSINAFQGKVVFPEKFLELKGVREKDSMVNLWITEPPVFSGLTPGGYTGKGVLFSLVFEAKKEGEGVVTIEQGQALLNDGKGTPAELSFFNFPFFVRQAADFEGRAISQVSMADDTEGPEPFEIRVAQDPSVFDGRHFLVFATQDKNSGIDYYEVSFVRSGRETAWEKARSPFLLRDYDATDEIRVKAVDRAGNERIAALSSGNSFVEFLLYGNIGILVLIGGGFGLWLWRRRGRK